MVDSTTLIISNDNDEDPRRLFGAFLASYANPKTRQSYREDLAQWHGWCTHWQLHPLTLRRTHIDLYAAWLTDSGYAVATRARRLSTIRSFYNWCLDEELIEASPAARVRPPRVERPDMPSLNKHQIHRLLTQAEQHGQQRPAETALVMLLFLCALRVSEACSVDIGDVAVEQYVPQLEVLGKGARRRTIVVPTRAMVWVDQAAAGRDVGPLLLNRAGNRMTRANAGRAVRTIAVAAGFDGAKVTPHTLRRSWIEIALQDRTPIRDVQQYAGHTVVTTTEYYDRRRLTLDRDPSMRVQSAVA